MYRLEVSDQALKQLRGLDKGVRERIRKKLDEIQERVQRLGIDPNRAVEKRLRSPFHRYLQQRVGDHRIWFVDIPEDQVLLVAFVMHKEDAERRLRS